MACGIGYHDYPSLLYHPLTIIFETDIPTCHDAKMSSIDNFGLPLPFISFNFSHCHSTVQFSPSGDVFKECGLPFYYANSYFSL